MKQITVTANDAGQRVDRFLSKNLSHLPPSLIARLIRQKHFRVNGKHPAPNDKLCVGDVISMYLNDEMLTPPPSDEEWRYASPDVEIAFEDENILIADKPSGLLSHSDDSGSPDTLINRIKKLLYERGQWDPQNEASFVPALANRIDRNTAGLVIAAKTAPALRELNVLIAEKKIRKIYLARVCGNPDFERKHVTVWLKKDSATNTVSVYSSPGPDRLTAESSFHVLSRSHGGATIECELFTGRTHQLRATLAYMGTPIAGDGKYGRAEPGSGQALVSKKLIFPSEDGFFSYLNGLTVTSGYVPTENGTIKKCNN